MEERHSRLESECADGTNCNGSEDAADDAVPLASVTDWPSSDPGTTDTPQVQEDSEDISTSDTGLSDLAAASQSLAGIERTYRPAGIIQRFSAALVDLGLLLLIIAFSVIAAILGGHLVGIELDEQVAGLVSTVVPLACLSAELFGDSTFGKRFLELKVTRPNGTPATLGRRAIRWTTGFASLILMTLYLLVLLSLRTISRAAAAELSSILESAILTAAVMWQALLLVGFFGLLLPTRRTLHDWMTGTAVYHIRHSRGAGAGHAFTPIRPTDEDPSGQFNSVGPSSVVAAPAEGGDEQAGGGDGGDAEEDLGQRV